MTARTVGQEMQFHLACIPVTRAEFNPYFVRKTLDEMRILKIKPRLLLMDREFLRSRCNECHLRCMSQISNACCIHYWNQKGNTGIYRRHKRIGEYVLSSQDGNTFRCNLIIVPKKNATDDDPYIGFVTNMRDCTVQDILKLPEEYRARWGIETGYRDAKRIMPHTTSRNDAIRLALFFLSLGKC